ncbi:uncharacterized protein LOC128861474 isoform X1 [Anastrepha ludens]|uniref:uncharacterized protein LOC128861474 isoform X1 n=1 Tax=Anastrepha ludens TaxID=28586 RepID=UPI0023B08162|nr:uncharacterized protein LOC128861474 isoform X1 [Anastrepha ludens]
MNMQILIISTLIVACSVTQAQPVDKSDAIVDKRSKAPLVFDEYSFPYYGGLRGQILQVVKTKDGTENMFILAPPDPSAKAQPALTRKSGISISTVDAQSQNTPSPTTAFEQDFNRIQIAAARLVAIQEIAKHKGTFSAEDNRIYAESLLELGYAAQNLANLQQSGQIKDFSLLLQPDFQMSHKQPLFTAESPTDTESSAGEQKVEEVTEQQLNEEDFLPPNTEDPYEDVSDTVAVTAPKKDASVAEAKPVGLSIAGEGGVASSKPNAVALSGRNGLAVSAPKATAIAGVSAEEAAAFSVSIPNRNNLVIKTVNRLPQRPVYDDYSEDYSDISPERSIFTRDAADPRADSPPSVISKKPKNVSASVGSNISRTSDSFVDKWKTMVAEDYAALARSAQLKTKESLRGLGKFSQSSADRKLS